jgi:hypothetical protein
MKHSRQQYSNNHQREHPDNKYILQKQRCKEGNNVQALSLHDRRFRILDFHPWGSLSSQNNMPSARSLQGTTNKGHMFGFHPGNRDSVHEEQHHPLLLRPLLLVPNTQRTERACAIESSLQPPWLSPPLSILWEFIHRHVPWHRQKSESLLHILIKPHSLPIGHAQPNQFQSRYLVTPCANQRRSPRGRSKLVSGQIQEADMKKIRDLVL